MSRQKEIEVISFDMDGTLIPKDFADEFWLKKIPELYSQKTSLSKKEAQEKFIKDYEKMGNDDIRWYQPEYWFSKYELDMEPRDVLKDLRSEYELYDDAKDVIKELHEDYTLIIISNGIHMFIEEGLRKYKTYFSVLYSSVSDFKMSSKTPSLYRKVCEDLDVKANRVMHIGDDRKNDYEPSKEVGMKSYLVSREKRNDDGLNDLRELLEIL